VVALLGTTLHSGSAYKPIFALGNIVTSAAYFLQPPGTNIHTVQIHIHGFSASILHNIVTPFSGAQHISAKAVLALALVFIMV